MSETETTVATIFALLVIAWLIFYYTNKRDG